VLDDSDIQTFYALRNLREFISNKSNRLLLWIGAGASRWRQVPSWEQLANQVHSRFSKLESNYDTSEAIRLIDLKDFPSFFKICRDVNEGRYFKELLSFLRPKKRAGVYSRFIESLRAIQPLNILTTNVDELLETSLDGMLTIQRSDLARCLDLLRDGNGFIGKIHGSTSQAESMVFTSSDYDDLMLDTNYLNLIQHIFVETTVLFIGYGLRDEYVLKLLENSKQLKGLFDYQHHYAVVNDSQNLPAFISPIRYLPVPHKDHRSSIQVIEELATEMKTSDEIKSLPSGQANLKSAHLISDIFPPGKTSYAGWEYMISDGARVLHGVGLTDDELLSSPRNSTHDLLVGLICFDTVYIHLTSIGNLLRLVGNFAFETLLKEDCLRFIEWPIQTVVLFPPEDLENGGELHTVVLQDETPLETMRTSIRKSLKPVIGKESEAEQVFEYIERRSDSIPRELELSIPKLAQGLLMRPSIRNLLGMSGGTLVKRLPQWMAFPILRLAYVVKLGATCQSLGIASTKLDQGFAELAAPSFAAAIGAEWADGMASYVLAHRFNTDLSEYSLDDQRVLDSILRFRASAEGVQLRREILDQLSINEGADFVASINAGLRAVIPTRTLQAARDKMAGLLIHQGVISNLTPALWNNTLSMKALSLWKRKSSKTFQEYCKKHHIGPNDYCPCASGERLRFCCNESLQN
jgi:hypothetical protein